MTYTTEQYKAAHDALLIAKGANNGAGVALVLHRAYCAWQHTNAANRSAPVRVILERLAFLNGDNMQDRRFYCEAVAKCEEIVATYKKENDIKLTYKVDYEKQESE